MESVGKQDRSLLVFSGIAGVLTHITGSFGMIFAVIFVIPWFGVFFSTHHKRDLNGKIMKMIKMAGVFVLCGMLTNILRYLVSLVST